jgi:single-stranded-DNA-specific exonuclease
MLNAGGRITTPYQSISTLLASSRDVYGRIQELIAVNETRKGLSRDAYERAKENANLSSPCILYVDETLEHGILGLVAAKLCELFHRPVGVFTRDGETYVGSFRAPIGIDLVKILDTASLYLLRYGGHAGAAGCTILVDSFSEAQEALLGATSQLYDMSAFVPTLAIDTILDMGKIDHKFMEQIESLRPFGQSFNSPLFMLQDISHSLSSLGQTGQHFKWNTETKGLDIIGFNLDDIASELSGNPLHLI